MTAKQESELDRLAPEPLELTLQSGSVVLVDRLKTRQMFALLRILTHGGASMISMLDFSDIDADEFAGRIIGVLLFAVPDAPEETIQFVRSMVHPKDEDSIIIRPSQYKLDGKGEPTKEVLYDADRRLTLELANPELDDTVSVIEAVIQREAPDIKALGRRLQQTWNLMVKTGQTGTKPTSRSKKVALSVASDEPST